MRFSYNVTPENWVQILDNNVVILERGPYANSQEPADWGSVCVSDLESGVITVEKLIGVNNND